ncbi:hypothetical protein RRG08_016392 [Elysia crispata]|uniref:Uncharacterized protein n=1 Tax=Elysia crispata TaxID=231223 RepID=A0AAE0Y970_9GAST|nr:hypothetical protein RRG08_016392 [Elysia crispata]
MTNEIPGPTFRTSIDPELSPHRKQAADDNEDVEESLLLLLSLTSPRPLLCPTSPPYPRRPHSPHLLPFSACNPTSGATRDSFINPIVRPRSPVYRTHPYLLFLSSSRSKALVLYRTCPLDHGPIWRLGKNGQYGEMSAVYGGSLPIVSLGTYHTPANSNTTPGGGEQSRLLISCKSSPSLIQSLERTFLNTLSLERTFLNNLSLERTFLNTLSLERTFLKIQSLEQSFLSSQNLGRTFLNKQSLERKFLNSKSLDKTFL